MKRILVFVFLTGVFQFTLDSALAYKDQAYLYLSPAPNAKFVSPETRYFLVRFETVSVFDLTNLSSFIQVTGASSGIHSGQAHIASDNQTVIFEVDSKFVSAEVVTVSLNPTFSVGSVEPFEYQFIISTYTPDSVPAPVLISESPESQTNERLQAFSDTTPAAAGKAGLMPNGVSVPSNFPHIDISINENPDDGYIFIDNRTTGSNSYNVIFDNTGSPIWYRQTNDERRDMKVQSNGVLTMLARDGYQRFIGLNTHYEEIAVYTAVNGYSTDEHELVVREDGTYYLIGNQSSTDQAIQGFSAEGDLIFQWRALDYMDPNEILHTWYDFPHMNSIDFDLDGHIILSSRHIDEITKINRDTGDIIWRLGGQYNLKNQFTYINDPLNGPSGQHAARVVGPNRYLIFDNGNLHSPNLSRAVEYELDTNAMTATLVWEFRETPDQYAYYMGNTQRLPNGNTLINWSIASLPKLTEVRPDGTKAFEMNWVGNFEAYRVWRCPWEGMALKPNLIIEPEADNITLLFNKFGDPNVAHYNIYGGTSPNPTQILDTSTTAMKKLSNLQNEKTYFFRVTAVDQISGQESDFSDEKSVYVDIQRPAGQNLVLNPDFALGKNNWTFQVSGSAAAAWTIENQTSHIDISRPGSQLQDIQMRQAGIPLYQDKDYYLAFDAWSSPTPRYIEVKVQQSQSPFTTYTPIIQPLITPVNQHFEYTFTMQQFSDPNSRVVFNTGASLNDVYIDNVVLLEVPTNPPDFNDDNVINLDDFTALSKQWGNTDCLIGNLCEGTDRDLSNVVDLSDLMWMVQYWLETQFPYHNTPMAIPGIIQAEDFDFGGQNEAYYDTTSGNSGGQYRPLEDVDMNTASDTGGGYNIGWMDAGEWLEYTVDVTGGVYDVAVRVASPSTDPKILRVLLNKTQIAEFDIPNTGGYQTWLTLVAEDVVIPGGQNQILRAEIDGTGTGLYNLNWIQIDENLTGG